MPRSFVVFVHCQQCHLEKRRFQLVSISEGFRISISTSGTRDLRTPVATSLQPPRTRNGPDWRCAGIRTSRVYPQVIILGIYSLTRREKTQNLGSNILNLGSQKFWKFSKTRSSIWSSVLSVVGGGGVGKVFISASSAVGEGCDPTVIPTLRTATMLCGNGLYTETVVVQPPS
jgi:hypothetical protein